jgi:hypothetical protein
LKAFGIVSLTAFVQVQVRVLEVERELTLLKRVQGSLSTRVCKFGGTIMGWLPWQPQPLEFVLTSLLSSTIISSPFMQRFLALFHSSQIDLQSCIIPRD